MFFELAVGVKALVVIVALIGLFLGLFPEIPKHTTIDQIAHEPSQPQIETVWGALVYANGDDARDSIVEVEHQQQQTAQMADDNATKITQYSAYTEMIGTKMRSCNYILFWAVVGLCALAFPLPRRGPAHA